MGKVKAFIKSTFDKGVDLDKKILEKIEKKFNLSPYQSKCANAAIGFDDTCCYYCCYKLWIKDGTAFTVRRLLFCYEHQ